MLESVAKWYVAQGALDIAGFKAGIYDPEDILGVATMTAAPEGAQKSEVKWEWAGETVVRHRPLRAEHDHADGSRRSRPTSCC